MNSCVKPCELSARPYSSLSSKAYGSVNSVNSKGAYIPLQVWKKCKGLKRPNLSHMKTSYEFSRNQFTTSQYKKAGPSRYFNKLRLPRAHALTTCRFFLDEKNRKGETPRRFVTNKVRAYAAYDRKGPKKFDEFPLQPFEGRDENGGNGS